MKEIILNRIRDRIKYYGYDIPVSDHIKGSPMSSLAEDCADWKVCKELERLYNSIEAIYDIEGLN